MTSEEKAELKDIYDTAERLSGFKFENREKRPISWSKTIITKKR